VCSTVHEDSEQRAGPKAARQSPPTCYRTASNSSQRFLGASISVTPGAQEPECALMAHEDFEHVRRLQASASFAPRKPPSPSTCTERRRKRHPEFASKTATQPIASQRFLSASISVTRPGSSPGQAPRSKSGPRKTPNPPKEPNASQRFSSASISVTPVAQEPQCTQMYMRIPSNARH